MKIIRYNNRITRPVVLIFVFLGILTFFIKSIGNTTVSAAELKGQFECLPAFYQTIGIFGPVEFRKLTFDETDKGIYKLIGSTNNDRTNAIGYNVNDDFIYGSIYVEGETHFARLDKSGNATDIGKLKGSNIVAADINKGGIYTYIQEGLLLGRYNISESDPTKRQLSDVTLSDNVGDVQDIVIKTRINETTGKEEEFAFGISSNGQQLVRVNTSTGLVERIKLKNKDGELIPKGSPYGAGWAALENKMYFSNNKSGNIYQIFDFYTNSPTYGAPKEAQSATGNDGASCPNAPDPFDYYNRPFLRVSGGDVRSGADFGGGDGNPGCKASDPDRNSLDAAIISNGYYSSDDSGAAKYWGSSSGQYGVFASGDIGNQDTNNDTEYDNNFYGNNFNIRSQFDTNYKDLMFSNTESSRYGRFYSGGSGVPCIDVSSLVEGAKDVFGATFNNFTQTTLPNRTRYQFTPQTVNAPITVKGGSKVAVINGDLNIKQDIKYSAEYGNKLNNMPNLVVVVLGDINISNNVRQIDGTYIAYPAIDGSRGVIRTCLEAGTKLNYNTCKNKLTINGRLLAKKIEWKRTWGTVGNPDRLALNIDTCEAAASDSKELIADAEICAAEFIDFSPEAFFNTSTSTITGEVGNVPLSTVDLPPVY